MRTVVETHVKSFNHDLLLEQIAAALPARVQGMGWAGFEQVGARRYDPIPEPRVIGTSTMPSGVTQDIAQPGELRFQVPDDWTAGETATLEGVLSGHDYTQQTAEQVRLDQDASDWQTLRNLYPDIITMNETQERQYIRLMARCLLRLKKATV